MLKPDNQVEPIGARRVRITSDGTPHGTTLVDDETGKSIGDVVGIVADPLTSDRWRSPWTGTLLRLDIKNGAKDIYQERVILIVGLEPVRR